MSLIGQYSLLDIYIYICKFSFSLRAITLSFPWTIKDFKSAFPKISFGSKQIYFCSKICFEPPWTFLAIQNFALSCVTRFILKTEQSCLGNVFGIDFSKAEMGSRLSEAFTENGILGILSTTDYSRIENWPLFLVKLWTLIGNTTTLASFTIRFAMYNDPKNFFQNRFGMSEQTSEKLVYLPNEIDCFRRTTVQLFGSYWRSNVRTSRQHVLSHI